MIQNWECKHRQQYSLQKWINRSSKAHVVMRPFSLQTHGHVNRLCQDERHTIWRKGGMWILLNYYQIITTEISCIWTKYLAKGCVCVCVRAPTLYWGMIDIPKRLDVPTAHSGIGLDMCLHLWSPHLDKSNKHAPTSKKLPPAPLAFAIVGSVPLVAGCFLS